MKKAATSLFHILMAVIVLVSGTGFTVKKMVCLSSGNIETGLYTLEGCCADEEVSTGEEVGSSCCKYSSESFYLEQDILLKESSFKKADIIFLPVILPRVFILPVVTAHNSFTLYADLPPPLSGRERLTLNSIFII